MEMDLLKAAIKEQIFTSLDNYFGMLDDQENEGKDYSDVTKEDIPGFVEQFADYLKNLVEDGELGWRT